MAPGHDGYRIGRLAALTGVTPDTLRYYERRGLLDEPARTAGRFRIYGPAAIERVRFIKRAQALGFTLAEVGELVGFNGRGGLTRCRKVRDLLHHRLAILDAQLAELGTLRETLRAALAECESAIAHDDSSACPVIELTPHMEERP